MTKFREGASSSVVTRSRIAREDGATRTVCLTRGPASVTGAGRFSCLLNRSVQSSSVSSPPAVAADQLGETLVRGRDSIQEYRLVALSRLGHVRLQSIVEWDRKVDGTPLVAVSRSSPSASSSSSAVVRAVRLGCFRGAGFFAVGVGSTSTGAAGASAAAMVAVGCSAGCSICWSCGCCCLGLHGG